MTKDYGTLAAHLFGDANEIRGDLFHDQKSYSKHMDRWNNAVGRRLAAGAAHNDEIARRAYDALKSGELIIDPIQDARYYTGPTPLPSRTTTIAITSMKALCRPCLDPRPQPDRQAQP
jgi:hypothetical protein